MAEATAFRLLQPVGRLLEDEGKRLVSDIRKGSKKRITRSGKQGTYSTTPSATGRTRNATLHEVEQQGLRVSLVVQSSSYWRYANRGRGPGRRPPVSALQDWVQAKGIARGETARSIAFAIAKTIADEGTNPPPANFVSNPVDQAAVRLRTRLRVQAQQGMRAQVTLSLQQTFAGR